MGPSVLTFYTCVINIQVGHQVTGTVRSHLSQSTDEEAAFLSPVALSLYVARYIVEATERSGLRDTVIQAHPPQQSLHGVDSLTCWTLGFKILQHAVVLAW